MSFVQSTFIDLSIMQNVVQLAVLCLIMRNKRAMRIKCIYTCLFLFIDMI